MDLAFEIIFFGMWFLVTTFIEIMILVLMRKDLEKNHIFGFVAIKIIIYLLCYVFKLYMISSMEMFFIFILILSPKKVAPPKGIVNKDQGLLCTKCGTANPSGAKFCEKCGASLDIKNTLASVEEVYIKSEYEILKSIVLDELKKNNFDSRVYIPKVGKVRLISTIIFTVLSFLFVSLYFFHISTILFIVLELINIVVYLLLLVNNNNLKYIIKEIKSRPDEKVGYVISSLVANSNKKNNLGLLLLVSSVVGVLLPIIVFSKPRIFYEYTKDGYYVRFYTMGLNPVNEITIPNEYKGKKVIGIRGNVFKNLPRLEKITLPDNLEVIRGRAFENDYNLDNVVLPDTLTYLGGSAFKNCRKLSSINIPLGVTEINGNTFENTSLTKIDLHDKITDIGGEAFKGTKLVSVTLPPLITEVHGGTFEGCHDLKKVIIPEGVVRIGGSAFRYCNSLTYVSIPSTVKEIGSSAFRLCTSLKQVAVPKYASINERAFKDSYTKIYYLDEIDEIIDKNNYNHEAFFYMNINETEVINKYRSDSAGYNETVKLLSIKCNGSYSKTCEYEYIYNNKTRFTLSENKPSYKINNNLVFIMADKYSFNNESHSSLYVYYN